MPSKKRKKKRAAKVPAHVDRLYKAVANYVEKCGGSVVVIGGVQVIQWPEDFSKNLKFTLGIKCLGRKPDYAAASREGGGS